MVETYNKCQPIRCHIIWPNPLASHRQLDSPQVPDLCRSPVIVIKKVHLGKVQVQGRALVENASPHEEG